MSLEKYWHDLKTIPAYDFIVRFQFICNRVPHLKPNCKAVDNLLVHFVSNVFGDKIRFVEIDKNLVNLIQDTNNEVFYRPLFYKMIFLNNNFETEDFVIKGIVIHDLNYDKINYALSYKNKIIKSKCKDWLITAIALSKHDYQEYYVSTGLLKDIDHSKTETKHIKIIKEITKLIRTIAINVTDLVNNNSNNIKKVVCNVTNVQNQKRVCRGKLPKPNKIIIRAKGDLLTYAKNYNKHCTHGKLSVQFKVRGHWRHFRSDRYAKSGLKGQKRWIMPHWKGQGIKIYKVHFVKKG